MSRLKKNVNACASDLRSSAGYVPTPWCPSIPSGRTWRGCVWRNTAWPSSTTYPAANWTRKCFPDVLQDVFLYFARKVQQLRDLGQKDIILDPGFGFGKTVEDNYALLAHLDEYPSVFGLPVLAGISRKSMITKVLDITPAEALNGTTVLNTLCLTKGASILRVHDVRPAVEAVRLVQAMQAQAPLTINH